jgi:hypothetical protein
MALSRTRFLMASVLTLALAACADAPPQTSATGSTVAPSARTATTATAAAQAGKPKLVCEETRPLGSLLPQRICLTPEEAAARKKASQEAIRNIQNSSSGTQNGGGGR